MENIQALTKDEIADLEDYWYENLKEIDAEMFWKNLDQDGRGDPVKDITLAELVEDCTTVADLSLEDLLKAFGRE